MLRHEGIFAGFCYLNSIGVEILLLEIASFLAMTNMAKDCKEKRDW